MIVEEIEKGELTYKQSQKKYGIQGRSTVLIWCLGTIMLLYDIKAYSLFVDKLYRWQKVINKIVKLINIKVI